MTPQTNAKPTAKPIAKSTAKAAVPVASAANSYSPSVPISLYKEVANELQSNKIKLESLKLQNQELVQQNQQLRVEIERVVQSALRLRQVADSASSNSLSVPSETGSSMGVEVHFEVPPAANTQPLPRNVKSDEPAPPASSRQLFTEQQPQQRRSTQTEKSSEMGGWWLTLTIVVIVITAFGTGFLIVRPLLPQR